jgi:hypothetical protein
MEMKFHALLTRALGGSENLLVLPRCDNLAPVTRSVQTNAMSGTIYGNGALLPLVSSDIKTINVFSAHV